MLGGKYHQHKEAITKLPLIRRQAFRAKLEKSRLLIETLMNIGQAYAASASQVALNWLVTYHGDAVVAIPGATKVEQARENSEALDFKLTPIELQKIEEVSRTFI